MGDLVTKGDFAIQPENTTAAISTDDWPLLLKNYDKCAQNALRSLGEYMLTRVSIGPNWSLHTYSMRMYTIQARSEILHFFRRHQPRQTLEPIQSRSCSLGQAHAPSRKDWA
jgi:hypothetical protein